jgi:undecaprenyl-diphosphatase
MLVSIDIDILKTINVDRITSLDGVFQFLSNTAPYISGLIPIGVILCGVIRKRKTIRLHGYKIASSYLLSVIVSNLLKLIIDRPRPFVTYPFIQKLSSGGGTSFPSGHTSDVFAIATAMSILFPRYVVVIPFYLWAVLVAYSRMDLGVHYPSDVLGGAVVGATCAVICIKLFNRKSKDTPV